jgi:hypothetical protein
MKKLFYVILLSALPATQAFGVAAEENRLSTGQGIAVPSMGNLVNLSRGYTSENAAGVMYQDGLRVSLQYAKNGVSDTGLELGYSGDTLGIAVGTWRRGCTNCEAENAVVVGAALGKSVALGLRYEAVTNLPTYGVGLIFGTDGTHRFGLNADVNDPTGSNNNTTNYGAGYGYVTKEHTIALELSKQDYEDPAATDPTVSLLSVSFQKRVGVLSASMSYEKLLNDPSDNNDDFWMGAGFNSTNWHLAIYADYHSEMMAVLSGYY